MLLLSSADFFQINLSITLSECQTIWIQIRTILIWVQTVYKGYQQTTKVAASKERVKLFLSLSLSLSLSLLVNVSIGSMHNFPAHFQILMMIFIKTRLKISNLHGHLLENFVTELTKHSVTKFLVDVSGRCFVTKCNENSFNS